MSEQPKVIIRCLVYNHEPYLRDCLEGFVMQKTNFSFKAVVHDDCSTDGSAAIIREYAEKYPHIIEPIYETENQYRKPDGSLERIMDAATLGRSPYLAYCEGDDYWIDPFKLQKQVDYMDAHPECSMVCTNAEVRQSDGIMSKEEKLRKNWFYHEKNCMLSIEDILYLSAYTCTILIKSSLLADFPKECYQTVWGAYAIKIHAALNGYVYCIAENSAVYRYQCSGAYTQMSMSYNPSVIAKQELGIARMLYNLNEYSNYKYSSMFNRVIYDHLCTALENDFSKFDVVREKYFGILFNHSLSNTKSIKEKIKYMLLKIKWFPINIGSLIPILKKMDMKTRLKVRITFIKYYISNIFKRK